MTDTLSDNESAVLDQLPATTVDIADSLNISNSYAYDLISNLKRKGVNIGQNSAGEYVRRGESRPAEPGVSGEPRRSDSQTQATITRKVRETLAEMESQLLESIEDMDPARADGGRVYSDEGTDIIMHLTDVHFGEELHNEHGDVVYNSDEAEARVNQYFDRANNVATDRLSAGEEIDAAHLLLGGDIITNESIYEGQAHEIDADLYEQIDRASSVLMDQIRYLSSMYPTVQVVCQAGNHGELRAPNSSEAANADDILYLMMDKVVRASGMDNVTFIQSDRTHYVNFNIRDWNAHMRHGHDASLEHIGTSAGKQRWLSWLVDHDFDVAFRGHYHMYKEEPINGVPVHMGGSPVPQSDFEESRAISGRPVGAIHGATDRAPTEWTEKIYFD